MSFTFLVGGAKSGKSNLALRHAADYQEKKKCPVYFIATAPATDEEMSEKIRRHRRERRADFITVEEQTDLLAAVKGIADGFVIVDCITLWIFNLLESGCDGDSLQAAVKGFAIEMAKKSIEGTVVSNEVGAGIVPADPYSRRYRDELGMANQILAKHADKTYFTLAGKLLLLSDGDTL